MTRAPLPMIKTIYERFARTASVFWRFRYDRPYLQERLVLTGTWKYARYYRAVKTTRGCRVWSNDAARKRITAGRTSGFFNEIWISRQLSTFNNNNNNIKVNIRLKFPIHYFPENIILQIMYICFLF